MPFLHFASAPLSDSAVQGGNCLSNFFKDSRAVDPLREKWTFGDGSQLKGSACSVGLFLSQGLLGEDLVTPEC